MIKLQHLHLTYLIFVIIFQLRNIFRVNNNNNNNDNDNYNYSIIYS